MGMQLAPESAKLKRDPAQSYQRGLKRSAAQPPLTPPSITEETEGSTHVSFKKYTGAKDNVSRASSDEHHCKRGGGRAYQQV